jgi:nitrogen-specific signal transduction histidine kinase/ActR/RegA family two-component response regulator
VAIKQDITERKNLELQIARTQRLESVGMLASGIAHDLNNIFAPIPLSLELLKLKYPDSDARRMLELIEGAGLRGAGIVRQVLTFARGMDGERMGVEPKYLVKELAQMLRETLPRNIAIEVEVVPVLPPVEADATQLHQVLLNLAVNARDAMPGGGRLTLGAQAVLVDEARAAANPPLKPGPCVALTVTDTGTGIAPEVLEHMFEPFYTTKPRDKGTGLGLSTVYGIVRSHGGSIEVTSQLGVGTAFTVLLPALGQAAADAPETPAGHARLAGAGRRVLVVDDEDSIRLVTARALEHHGFVVETAGDGLEALEKFRANPFGFAALITDLMMPQMGGRELVEQVRRLAPNLPVLVSSGLAETETDQADSPAHPPQVPHTLLRKPYTEDELLRALGEEIALRSGQ